MDKKSFKEFIKSSIAVCFLIFFIYLLPLGIVGNLIAFIIDIIGGYTFASVIKGIVNSIVLGFSVIFVISIIMSCISRIFSNISKKYKKRKNAVVTDEYIRDLPENFPPAIASFIIDLNIDATIDYTATIAYLISKEYIKVEDNDVKILKKDIEGLSSHEKFAFENIVEKRILDSKEFERLIKEDAEKMGLINRKIINPTEFSSSAFKLSMGFLFFISILLAIFMTEFLFRLLMCSLIVVFISLLYSIYCASKPNEIINRTVEGTKESIRWSGMKNFFNDYTLISDRKLEEIVTLGEYIPYAVALGEAKNIEKFVLENDSYRNLILGNTMIL